MLNGLEIFPATNTRDEPVLSLGPLKQGDAMHPCLACRTPMLRLVSAPDMGAESDVKLSLYWCAKCKPTEAGTTGSTLCISPTKWIWDGRGYAFISKPISAENSDSFTSRIGGRSLLMDEVTELPWEDGEAERPWRHVLSLSDHPSIGFDPTNYPLIIVAAVDDSGLYSWVADGR